MSNLDSIDEINQYRRILSEIETIKAIIEDWKSLLPDIQAVEQDPNSDKVCFTKECIERDEKRLNYCKALKGTYKLSIPLA